MSTGPLNLNWLSSAIKSLTPASREPKPSASSLADPGLAGDESSVNPGETRYMAYQAPASEEEASTEPQDSDPSNPLGMEWVTNTPAGSGSLPSSANRESSAGLDVEWKTGPSASQSLGTASGSQNASSGNGLGVEWRTGNSASQSLGGVQAGGGRATPSAGLGVDWQNSISGSSWQGSRGDGGRATSGGLQVEWSGGSGSVTDDSTNPIGGGGLGSEPLAGNDGVQGGSNGDRPQPEIGDAQDSRPTPPPSGLDPARLAEIRAQLAAALPALPERPQSQDWKQNDLSNRASLIMGIRGDAGLQAAFANWDALPNELRLEAGKRIAALEGAAYGFEPAAIQLDTSLRKPSYGYYHPGENQVHLSPDTLANLKEFVNTVTHEQAHAYQWEKAVDAKKGRMSADDPLYATAMAWHANYFNYTDPSYGYQAYRTQPIEAHAFATGDAVVAGVFS